MRSSTGSRVRARKRVTHGDSRSFMILFVIYSQVLNVSAARSTIKRDKKGRVSGMKNVKVKVSGRMAALLAPAYAPLAGLPGLPGGQVEPSSRGMLTAAVTATPASVRPTRLTLTTTDTGWIMP
jgi:hypothetical protein